MSGGRFVVDFSGIMGGVGEGREPGCKGRCSIGIRRGVVENISEEEVVQRWQGTKPEEGGNGLWVGEAFG